MKYLVAFFFSAVSFGQLCIQPPGTSNILKLVACAPVTGVALSTLAANSLAIALPNGTYLPVIVANPTAGTTTPAAATIVPFLDPVGNSYSIPVLAFTMVEGFAILQHSTVANPALLPVALNTPLVGPTYPPIVTCLPKPLSILDDACAFLQ